MGHVSLESSLPEAPQATSDDQNSHEGIEEIEEAGGASGQSKRFLVQFDRRYQLIGIKSLTSSASIDSIGFIVLDTSCYIPELDLGPPNDDSTISDLEQIKNLEGFEKNGE